MCWTSQFKVCPVQVLFLTVILQHYTFNKARWHRSVSDELPSKCPTLDIEGADKGSPAALCPCWRRGSRGHSCCPGGRCWADTWWPWFVEARVRPWSTHPSRHRAGTNTASSWAPDTPCWPGSPAAPVGGAGRDDDRRPPGSGRMSNWL